MSWKLRGRENTLSSFRTLPSSNPKKLVIILKIVHHDKDNEWKKERIK